MMKPPCDCPEDDEMCLGCAPVEFDFFTDETLPACALRNEGDDICESCQ